MYLEWRGFRGQSREATNITEVNGDALKVLGSHRLSADQLPGYRSVEQRHKKKLRMVYDKS